MRRFLLAIIAALSIIGCAANEVGQIHYSLSVGPGVVATTHHKIRTNDLADQILDDYYSVVTAENAEFDLISFTSAELGDSKDDGVTAEWVSNRGKELGYSLCPVGVVLLLRLIYFPPPNRVLNIVTKFGFDGLIVWYLGRNSNADFEEYFLFAADDSHTWWGVDRQWIFCRRK